MKPSFRVAAVAPLAASALVACGQETQRSEDLPGPQPQPEEAAVPFFTEAELEGLLAAFDVPGISVTAIDNCAVGETRVSGFARLSPNVPVAPNTVFEAASLSKPVFAWIVLQLTEEGIIDLDEPFAESFSYERIPDKERYKQLTPRLVLTHRTGLPNWVGLDVPFPDRTEPIPFEADPGAEHTYSGEGFQLLQAFVENRTGKSLETLFRERLGDVMPNSTYKLPLPSGVAPSKGYDLASDPESEREMQLLDVQAMSAYSLATTSEDFARFLSKICRREGLSEETYTDMFTPQPVDAVDQKWGLGITVADVDGATFIGHTGNNGEYRALGGFLQETGDGLVILTNGGRGTELIDAATSD